MDIDFSPAIWAQERNFLYVSRLLATSTHVLVEVVGHSELSAKYAIPPSLSVNVDITDVVRMYETGTFKVSELSGDTVVEEQTPDPWYRAGLIDPAKVLIPDHDLQDAGGGALIVPPNKILFNPENPGCNAECYFAEQNNWLATGDAAFENEKRNIVITGDFMLATTGFTAVKGYSPEYADKCTPLAFLTWRSFTGGIRIHAFKVVKQATEAVDEVEMLTADNSYDIRKGRRDSVTLRLDGLNRYDLWYYGDVVTSSLVGISFDDEKEYRAEVTTKNIELPANDEGALGSLEITLNYLRYDTL